MAAAVSAGAVLVGAGLVGAPPAQAAFPGNNGLIVYFPVGGSPSVVINPDGTGRHPLGIAGFGVRWSPDGRRIVLTAGPGDPTTDVATVYVADADGSHARAVGLGLDPAWAPDGQHLVLVSASFPSTPACGQPFCLELGSLDLRTGALRQLTDNAPGIAEFSPSWSPDGTQIAYSDSDGSAAHGTLEETTDVRVMPATGLPAGQRGRLVGANVGFEDKPDWSPDGQQVVFQRVNEGAGWPDGLGLAVVNADGSNEHLVVPGDGHFDPVWSPDGARIAYEQDLNAGTPGLYLVPPDGSGPATRIGDVGSDPDWQPLPAANSCTITGTPGPDVLRGTAGADVICGLGGDDTIYGGGGRDVIRGGEGNDTIRGGVGNDSIDGGPGHDAIRGDQGNDTLTGGGGTDTLLGGDGDDTLTGGPGTDTLTGGDGTDDCTDSGATTTFFGCETTH